MPIIKSAKKRVRIAKKATTRNAKTKRNFRQAIKDFQIKLGSKSTKTSEALSQAESALDIAAKKGLLHKKTVARKKKQLASQAKAAGIKRTAKTVTSKTTAAKKVTKKTTPKSAAKPTSKPKSPAKKAAPKKKATKK